MADGLPDIFFAIFKGRAGLETGEGLDGVVEVGVAKVVWYFEEEFLRAHRSTIKYRFALNNQFPW
jgi:hypothetical protein